jgi:ribosomal protein S18 acetylase RimI-like enzyme
MTDGVYVHPDATSSVVPHLRAHLPDAATELYVVEVPPAPASTLLATFLEFTPGSAVWSVGVIAITGAPETEFWFWSSAEEVPTTGEDADNDDRFQTAYVQFVQMLKFVGRMHPEKGTLSVGSLHTWIASHIPRSSRDYLSPPWTKFAFSKDSLPPPNSSAQGIGSKYFFKSMGVEELDEVVQTSAIPRTKATLAAASNTAAYPMSSEEKRAQAWCFISREGAISSVYVRPEARGMGLGKETMRRELEKEFVHREFVMVDVSPTNIASHRLCQSLGGRRAWEVVWVGILLSQFR